MSTGASLKALQWLIYIQENDDNLINKNGERIQLEHKFFRGEKRISGWDIDGFAQVDDRMIFYEFLGCFHHKGCEDCGNPNDVDERFERKKVDLERLGTLIIMRECKWMKLQKNWKSKKTPTFPDVLNTFSLIRDILS